MEISVFGYKVELEILILIGIVYIILVGNTICGCCNVGGIIESMSGMKKKEGFSGASTNNGDSSRYSLNNYNSVDASKWGQPSLSITPGQPYSPAVQQL
jgi:hypothetical protein